MQKPVAGDSPSRGLRRRLLLSLLLGLAILLLVILVAARLGINSSDVMPKSLSSLLLSLTLGVPALFMFFAAWRRQMRVFVKSPANGYASTETFAAGWLARYIPGKISSIIAKTWQSNAMGVSRREAATAASFDLGLHFLVSVVLGVGAALLIGFSVAAHNEIYIVLGAAIIVIAFVYVWRRPLARWYQSKGLPLAEFTNRRLLPRSEDAFIAIALVAAGSLIYSVGVTVWVLGAIPTIDLDFGLLFILANLIGGLSGMLAFFAPAGVGVREGVIYAVLAPTYGAEMALAAAAAGRLASVVFDGFFVLCMLGLSAVQRFIGRFLK